MLGDLLSPQIPRGSGPSPFLRGLDDPPNDPIAALGVAEFNLDGGGGAVVADVLLERASPPEDAELPSQTNTNGTDDGGLARPVGS